MVAKPADQRAVDELMQVLVKTLTGKTTADTKDDTESRSDAEATADVKTTDKPAAKTKDGSDTKSNETGIGAETTKSCNEAGPDDDAANEKADSEAQSHETSG